MASGYENAVSSSANSLLEGKAEQAEEHGIFRDDGNESIIMDDEMRDLMAPNASDLAALTSGVVIDVPTFMTSAADLSTALTKSGLEIVLSSTCDDPLQIVSMQLPLHDDGNDGEAILTPPLSMSQQQSQPVQLEGLPAAFHSTSLNEQMNKKQNTTISPPLDGLILQMSSAMIRGCADSNSPDLAWMMNDLCVQAFEQQEDKLLRLYSSLEHIDDIYKELAAQVENHEKQLVELQQEILMIEGVGETTTSIATKADEREVQDRQLELIHINRNMQQISEMYNDLDALVRSHHAQIDALESDIRSITSSTVQDPPKFVTFMCMEEEGKSSSMIRSNEAPATENVAKRSGLRIDEDFYFTMPLETILLDLNAVREDVVGIGQAIMTRACDGIPCCTGESERMKMVGVQERTKYDLENEKTYVRDMKALQPDSFAT